MLLTIFVGGQHSCEKTPSANVINSCILRIWLAPATESEIINIIKNMKNKKSSGLDEIPDFITKTC